jgi:hypothetical protein
MLYLKTAVPELNNQIHDQKNLIYYGNKYKKRTDFTAINSFYHIFTGEAQHPTVTPNNLLFGFVSLWQKHKLYMCFILVSL